MPYAPELGFSAVTSQPLSRSQSGSRHENCPAHPYWDSSCCAIPWGDPDTAGAAGAAAGLEAALAALPVGFLERDRLLLLLLLRCPRGRCPRGGLLGGRSGGPALVGRLLGGQPLGGGAIGGDPGRQGASCGQRLGVHGRFALSCLHEDELPGDPDLHLRLSRHPGLGRVQLLKVEHVDGLGRRRVRRRRGEGSRGTGGREAERTSSGKNRNPT